MTKPLAFAWALLLALFVALPAQAADPDFPKLTGRVVDAAGLLTPADVAELTQKSEALEDQSGRQFVVATVPSLQGETIESYGYQLGRHWGIGQEDKDDGVLLLVAPNERKVRIETGYGARVFLTDAVSSVIIRESIIPRFKEGDMAGGILAGADQIVSLMAMDEAEAARYADEVDASEAEYASGDGGSFPVIFFFIIAFFILANARKARGRRYKRSKYSKKGVDPLVILWGLDALDKATRSSRRASNSWSGGSSWGSGGGGFSGGGGSFGGGGASGSW